MKAREQALAAAGRIELTAVSGARLLPPRRAVRRVAMAVSPPPGTTTVGC